MTSNTFKSTEGGFSIGIRPVKDGVQFRITNLRGTYQQFNTPSSVAAAQALAILEAAGVEPDREPLECQVSLGTIVADLQETIQYAEALASANREQAKLEAEALRLANEFYGTDWDFFPCSRTVEMQQWLAVARRARELNKEDNNGR